MIKSATHLTKEDFFVQESFVGKWTVLDDQIFPEQKINTRTQENDSLQKRNTVIIKKYQTKIASLDPALYLHNA